MATHNQTGKLGEKLGSEYLVVNGYEILSQNWRHSHWEVDIIAKKNNVLHFIEVKTRRTKRYGQPEEKVGNKKIKNLINAAEEYLHLHPEWKRIQFNILSISMIKDETCEYFLIEDVYL